VKIRKREENKKKEKKEESDRKIRVYGHWT